MVFTPLVTEAPDAPLVVPAQSASPTATVVAQPASHDWVLVSTVVQHFLHHFASRLRHMSILHQPHLLLQLMLLLPCLMTILLNSGLFLLIQGHILWLQRPMKAFRSRTFALFIIFLVSRRLLYFWYTLIPKKNTEDLLHKTIITDCKSCSTSLSTTSQLSALDGGPLDDPVKYCQIFGSL